MKKTIIFSTLTATMLLAAGTTAFADDVKTQPVESSRNTKASISFISDSETTPPETGLPGNLRFLGTPNLAWDFGKDLTVPTNGTAIYDRDKKGATGKQFIAVSDDRLEGSQNEPDGWHVTAQLGALKDGEDELTANILYKVVDLAEIEIDRTIVDNDYVIPDLSKAGSDVIKSQTEAVAGLTLGTAVDSVTRLQAGAEGATMVMSAANEKNLHHKAYGVEIDDVKLELISGAKAGKSYNGNLVWKLSNAPVK